MRHEFPDLLRERAEDHQPDIEGPGELHISDGMDPVPVPERITKENYATVFGPVLPEGLSTEIFEDGGLELEQ